MTTKDTAMSAIERVARALARYDNPKHENWWPSYEGRARVAIAAARQSDAALSDDYEAWRRFEAAIGAEAKRLCRSGCSDEPCHCRADLDKDWRRDAINSLRAALAPQEDDAATEGR